MQRDTFSVPEGYVPPGYGLRATARGLLVYDVATDAPINDGVSPGDDTRHRRVMASYLGADCALFVGVPEQTFAAAWKNAGAIADALPLHHRQLGVTYGWLSFGQLTDCGGAMLYAVACIAGQPAQITRKQLHADRLKREADEKAAGFERMREHNARVATDAKARREALEIRKAAIALAVAEAKTSFADHTPGAVPVTVWLSQETLFGARSVAPGQPVGQTLRVLADAVLRKGRV